MPHAFELYGQWCRRDLSQRFAGSALGPLWLLLQPLSLVLVITLVFNGFFRTKWPGGDGSAFDYGLKVFVGLAVHAFMAEMLSRSPSSILSHAYLVTKVRFPLPLIPAVAAGVALAQLGLSLLLVMVLLLVAGWVSPMTALTTWWAIPLLLLPSVLLMMGVGWFLAATGVYLRDLGNLTPALSSLLMFLMPVFYPAEMVPEGLSWFVEGNPLAQTIESLRALLFLGQWPDPAQWFLHLLACAVVLALGWWYFQRVRPGFADVL